MSTSPSPEGIVEEVASTSIVDATSIAPVGEAVMVVDAPPPANTNAVKPEPESWSKRSELWRTIARIMLAHPEMLSEDARRITGRVWSPAYWVMIRKDLRIAGFELPDLRCKAAHGSKPLTISSVRQPKPAHKYAPEIETDPTTCTCDLPSVAESAPCRMHWTPASKVIVDAKVSAARDRERASLLKELVVVRSPSPKPPNTTPSPALQAELDREAKRDSEISERRRQRIREDRARDTHERIIDRRFGIE